MSYQEIQNMNVTGLDGILIYVANEVPLFVPTLLISLWILITMSIYLGSRKYTGQSDFFAAASAGGFVSFVIGTLFTIVAGIINVWTLGTTFGILIISVLMLLPRRNRD